MQKMLWTIIAISGFMAVLVGAAAAHWLSSMLEPADIMRIEKAATYQIYHTLALLAIATLYAQHNNRYLTWSAYAFTTGILLFSGSLYLYSFTHFKPLVYITPMGGLTFMVGWLALLGVGLEKFD